MAGIAKSTPQGATRSILGHCTDVAVVAEAIMSQPVIRARLSTAAQLAMDDAHIARLAVLAGLHDVGKTLAGFQVRIHGRGRGSGHVVEALAVLVVSPEVRKAAQIELLSVWVTDIEAALFCSICHHGGPVTEERIATAISGASNQLVRTVGGDDPLEEIAELLTGLLSAFPAATEPTQPINFTPEMQHLYAGIVMTADWMGSGFPLEGPNLRRQMAQETLNATRWSGWLSDTPAAAILEGRSPIGAQTTMLDIPVDNQLVIVEAPTGTGKTEAALLWASRLVDERSVDGLYFAVPTRSAATELHERIGRVMTTAHPALRGKVMRAIPGQLDTDPWQDGGSLTWALGSPKKALSAPIAVGTIDQAMLSILRVNHSWMRAAMLSRQLLVIDEVHASDPYMNAVVEALTKRHLELGGYALAMSATLGETLRSRLEGRARMSYREALTQPYPLVRCGSDDISVLGGKSRDIQIDIEEENEIVPSIEDAVGRGQSVLVIRSTVDDAIRTRRVLKEHGLKTLLHHSRWADEDRRYLDKQVMGIMGPRGTRYGVAVVGTQTLEQSLDIDADLLVTDACPADVLLQRIGRLHRHREGTRPSALIVDPGSLKQYVTERGEVHGTKSQGWPWVYENLLAVDQTLSWVRERGSIVIPDHSRQLVESSTHVDYLREIAQQRQGRWLALWQRLYGQQAATRQLADAGLVDWSSPYRDAVVDSRIPTRLDDGKFTVPTPGLRSPLTGLPVEAIPVPGRWLSNVPKDTEGLVDQQVIHISSVLLVYDSDGLRRARPDTSA